MLPRDRPIRILRRPFPHPMHAQAFPSTAIFRRVLPISSATVGDLAVILNVEAGSYHGLNRVGTHIWNFLDEPHSVAEVAADLPRHFTVEPDEAEQATRAFLADLAERGLIERVGS